MMKRIVTAAMMVALLGGCSLLGRAGGGEKKTKTPVIGTRIPILATESDAKIDPTIAAIDVAIPDATVNEEWGQPGGNAAKSMGNLALGRALAVAWNAKMAGGSPKARLAAAPVIGGGMVFAMGTDATVTAFRTESGARVWATRITDAGGNDRALFGGGASYADGKLYAVNGVGDIAALDAKTGAILWKKHPGPPLRGSPTIANGNVYAVSQDNQLFALKTDTGDTVWNEAGSLEAAGVFGVAAPAMAQGTVIAGFSSGELNAYRYENGRIVWQDALSRTSISTSVSSVSDIDAPPAIEGGQVYAVGQGGRMVALELTTGQRLWELNIAGIAMPWVAGDWLFVVTDDARMLCIQRTTGRIRWSTQLPEFRNAKKSTNAIEWYGPVLAGGRLLVANSSGALVNVAVADGAVGTSTRVGKAVSLPPVVAGNQLYILTDEGTLVVYK